MTSPTEILSENSLGQKRISFFSDNKLLECWIEKENTSLRIGEIHYARVIQVEKLLNRIFYKLNNGLEVSSRLNDKNPNIGALEIITITAEERENKPAHAQRGFFLKGFCFVIIHKTLFNLIFFMAIFEIAKCPLCAGSKLPPSIPIDLFKNLTIYYGLVIPFPETKYLYDVN